MTVSEELTMKIMERNDYFNFAKIKAEKNSNKERVREIVEIFDAMNRNIVDKMHELEVENGSVI